MEVPPEVVEGLWTYLDDILHSRKLHNVLSQGKTISLRLTVAQVFTNTSVLQEFHSTVLFTPTLVLYYSITQLLLGTVALILFLIIIINHFYLLFLFVFCLLC